MTSVRLYTHLSLIIQQYVYESRKSQILNAKGTLKAPKNNKERKNSIISDEISSFQFFLHEKDFEEHSTGDDSTSLVSEEDFAGIKDQWTRTIPEDGSLTIRSHRGTYSIYTYIYHSRFLCELGMKPHMHLLSRNHHFFTISCHRE